MCLMMLKWSWLPAILVVQFFCWLIRLYWLNKSLQAFILVRLLHMIPIMLAVVAIGFMLIQLAPGDVLDQLRLNPDISPKTLKEFEESFGLNQPWFVQFVKYITNAIKGDFGYSQSMKAPVFEIVSQRAGNTLLLALASMVLAWGFSIPAGIVSATHQYKWQDQVISFLSFTGLAIPNFFLAFLLIYLITQTGLWLPIGGMQSPHFSSMSLPEKILDTAAHLAVPAFVLATASMAQLTRLMRANMIEIMGRQYIITARAKGLPNHLIINKHALKNAINPMITIFGVQLGELLSGAALTEQILSWPGLGKLVLSATLSQDLYLVAGSLVYTVALIVMGNLIADILLAITDPRVRIAL